MTTEKPATREDFDQALNEIFGRPPEKKLSDGMTLDCQLCGRPLLEDIFRSESDLDGVIWSHEVCFFRYEAAYLRAKLSIFVPMEDVVGCPLPLVEEFEATWSVELYKKSFQTA